MLKIESTPTLGELSTMFVKVDLSRVLGEIATEIAFAIERFSKQVTPVRTGRLRASIGVSTGWGSTRMTAFVQPHVNYAYYVHEGKGTNRRIGPRPFMKWGVDFTLQKYTGQQIGWRLDKELRRYLSTGAINR